MLEILRFCDVENVQKNSAALIASCLSSVLATKDSAILAICGGRSVSGVFTHLLNKNIPWSRVHFFMADERWVPLDSPDSNYKLAKDTFWGDMIDSGKISETNIHPFVIGADIDGAISDYNDQLNEFGGAFDIVLLSIGEDGHIASLFPYHDSIRDSVSKGYILVEESPKPPARRISASKYLIKNSKYALLMATGESKRQALTALDDEVYDEVDCPAKIIKSVPCSYLLTDQNNI